MFILSAGKSTILSQFDSFETTSIYQHTNGETVDFQIFPQQHVFVEVNKKSGLEILRLKTQINEGVQIQRVQKLNIEKVYCVACSKQSINLIALGLSNGQVQIYNYKASEFVNRFKTENNRNSVCFADFNLSDDYIAAVFDNGELSTYGIKTKTKLDTFKIDGLSTLARFHPSKKFHLGIASSAGAVTLYDVQTKKKVFHSKEAHVSPCRDLCLSSSNLEQLVSVGYDCVVNIFDVRHKGQPQRINNCHPLSSVSISECGTYICVGSLKGEIIAYDVRNTKSSLRESKLHEGAVTRLTFVPNLDSSVQHANTISRSSFIYNQPMTEISDAQTTLEKSFSDMIDFQSVSHHDTNRRSSFNWEALTGQKFNEIKETKSEDTFLDYVNKRPRKPKSNLEPLSEIMSDNENKAEKEKFKQKETKKSLSAEDKENLNKYDRKKLETVTNKEVDAGFADKLENIVSTERENFESDKLAESCVKTVKSATTPTVETHYSNNNKDLIKLVSDIHSEMSEKLKNMEEEIKFNAETNKWQIFTQAAKIWNQQNDAIEEIRETLAVLVRADPFVNEFLRLKEENAELKAKLNTILKN